MLCADVQVVSGRRKKTVKSKKINQMENLGADHACHCSHRLQKQQLSTADTNQAAQPTWLTLDVTLNGQESM